MENIVTLYADEHNLSGAAMSTDFEPDCDGDISQIFIVSKDAAGDAAAITNDDLVITLDQADGTDGTVRTKWNVPLLTQALDGLSYYVFRPTGRCSFSKGDKINIAISADNATERIYATLKYIKRSSN